MKKIIIIFIMILCLCGGGNYSFSQTAGGFLEIPIGAEAQGQGGAFTSRVSPVSVYWNPSALSYLSEPSILLQHTKLTLDVKHNFLSYVYPFPKFTAGLSLITSDVGGIEIRSSSQFDPLAVISSKENAYILSVAKKMDNKFKLKNNIDIDDDVSVGVNYKHITQDIYTGSSKGKSFDIGILYKRKDGTSLGLVLQELGGKIKWNTGKKDDIPRNIKFGISKKFLQDKLITSFDIGKRKYDSTKYFLGSEYSIGDIVKLRCGLDDGRFTVGTGFNLGNFQIDYSYKKEDLFGDTQRFTIAHKLWKEKVEEQGQKIAEEVKLPVEEKVEIKTVEHEPEVKIEKVEEKPIEPAETKTETVETKIEEVKEEVKLEVPSEEIKIPEIPKVEVEPTPVEAEVEVKVEEKTKPTLPEQEVKVVAKEKPVITPPSVEEEYDYTIIVEKEDVLWKIAKVFCGDANLWEELASYNELSNPHLIYSRQEIIIPGELYTGPPEEKIEKEEEVKPEVTEEVKIPATAASYITSVKGDIVEFYTVKNYKQGEILLIKTEDGKVVSRCEVLSILEEISVCKIIFSTTKISPFSFYVTNY